MVLNNNGSCDSKTTVFDIVTSFYNCIMENVPYSIKHITVTERVLYQTLQKKKNMCDTDNHLHIWRAVARFL